MFSKTNCRKLFCIIPITFLTAFVEILLTITGKPIIENDNTFPNAFSSVIFNDYIRRQDQTITQSMFGLLQPILFHFLYGTYLYKDLHISSIYYFVREPCRKKWYNRKVLSIISYAAIFIAIYFIIMTCIVVLNTNDFQWNDLFQILSSYLSIFFLTIFTTLIINIISIHFGSATAFVFTYIFMLICFFASSKVYEIKNIFLQNFLTKINPIDNTMLTWQSSNKEIVIALLINIIYFVLIYLYGLFLITKMDVGLIDKEAL